MADQEIKAVLLMPDTLDLTTATYWQLRTEVERLRALRDELVGLINDLQNHLNPTQEYDQGDDCYGL